ncbi:NADPH-dependent mycothiol reductase Mtr [Cutibacterium acnes JCM 18918]|nr:NADPH-dependent mycothiol reductase Mtr [Cutibacterium acnes JCM 18918]
MIHTSDTIMRLAELPQRLVILGGGLIAAEFAHIFSGLGSQVTVINRSGRMLRHEDREISQRFTEQMGRRVRLRMAEGLVGVDRDPGGHLVVLTVDGDGVDYDYPADVVLNATGRVSNGDRLNLPAAGVDVDDDGFVVVDKHQRTNVEHIWALATCAPPGSSNTWPIMRRVWSVTTCCILTIWLVLIMLRAARGVFESAGGVGWCHGAGTVAIRHSLRGVPSGVRGRRLWVGHGGRGALRQAAGRSADEDFAGGAHHWAPSVHPHSDLYSGDERWADGRRNGAWAVLDPSCPL